MYLQAFVYRITLRVLLLIIQYAKTVPLEKSLKKLIETYKQSTDYPIFAE